MQLSPTPCQVVMINILSLTGEWGTFLVFAGLFSILLLTLSLSLVDKPGFECMTYQNNNPKIFMITLVS